jgi:hypothetical protein
MVAATRRLRTSLSRQMQTWLTTGGRAIGRFVASNSIQERHLSAIASGRDDLLSPALPQKQLSS